MTILHPTRMSKALVTFIVLCIVAAPLISQSFRWIRTSSIEYSQNPQLPQSTLCSDAQNRVIIARMDSVVIHVGDFYGKYALDCRTADGTLVWTFLLQSQVYVKRVCSNKKGDILVCGSFIGTLKFSSGDSLPNTEPASSLNTNSFLCCLNAKGELLWKRNTTLTPLSPTISALACDAENHFWYATNDFLNSALIQLDDAGKDVLRLEQANVKILSSFCFDKENNIYLCGATGSGEPFRMASLSQTVSETYAMFVARYTASHQASWVHFIHDITFSAPQVAADAQGNAYFAGMIFDSAGIGTLRLHQPKFNQDIFVVKIDSNGSVLWGNQTPSSTSTPTGTMERGSNDFMTVLPNGGVVLSGTIRGTLNWGNNVVFQTASITNYRCGFVAFSPDGTAQWAAVGGVSSVNHLHSVWANSSGDIYFSAAIMGEGAFGTLDVTAPSFSFVVGKLSSPLTISVEQSEVKDNLLSPNPSTDGVIRLHESIQGSNIKVFNSLGQTVSGDIAISDKELNLSFLPAGMYLLQFTQGQKNTWATWLRY